MSTLKHPGIDMVENLRARGDRDDKQIASRLRQEKAALNIAMEKTAQSDPAKLSGKDIEQLRAYEVALAYIDIDDLSNTIATSKLRDAIKGVNPTSGQPSDSGLYANRKEYALTHATERVTIHLS